MMIIGADYHPGFQAMAFVDEETGEFGERELRHPEEAERFYRNLKGRQVRVGMEATGHCGWFEALLAELKFELWLGDPSTIRSKRVRKQKHDREDARLLLRLLRNGEFPRIRMALVKKVVWISSSGSLETGLKHGVELVKDGGDVLGHAFPSALFQGRDGETKFELERIL